jgi:hypothetical protein
MASLADIPPYKLLSERTHGVQRSLTICLLVGVAGVLAATATFTAKAATAPAAPVVLSVSTGGVIRLTSDKTEIAHIAAGLFEAGWQGSEYTPGSPKHYQPGLYRGKIRTKSGGLVETDLRTVDVAGGVSLAYTLTPKAALRLNSLHITIAFPERELAGQAYVCDGKSATIPAKLGTLQLFDKRVRAISLTTRTAGQIRIEFAVPTHVLLQDDRRWGPSFSIRIGEPCSPEKPLMPGVPVKLAFSFVRPAGLSVDYDAPVVLAAGADWIPLDYSPEIEAGSALDFSKLGLHDAPAGKHGRLLARPDGTFAFAQRPNEPRRFYGVNLCGTAQYVDHEQADRLADRLARIGYNCVRIHHYEATLVQGKTDSVTLLPERLDQLDFFLAACKRRGLYITTDLYVSRPVQAREIWDGVEGRVEMNDFKLAVMVNEKALANWQAFARNLLGHRNPYTGLTYAEDPALAWLCMINEGNVGNFLGRIKSPQLKADCQKKWNAFLAKRYANVAALRAAWQRDPAGDPAAGSVPLVGIPWKEDNSPACRDAAAFCAELDVAAVGRMKAFLRDELHCQALLTNMNAWTNPLANQAARAAYDYVDDHFYVDHPHFIERPWTLPSSCPNSSPIAAGAPGGCSNCFVRLFDRPFVISEYNYSGPGQFRGVGGILTGCLGALQDCGALWRFAYSHTRENLFRPSTAGYFDVGTDPFNQIAERAALCLYLRGDMRPAPHKVSIALNTAELLTQQTPCRRVDPSWTALARITRVGTSLTGQKPIDADLVLPAGRFAVDTTGRVLAQDPYADDAGERILDAMRAAGWMQGNVTDLEAKRLQSETRELLVDAARDVMILDTARTAGGYGPEGETIRTAATRITLDKSCATVWVSSLDAKPIRSSRHMLLCHLTDLQNTGAMFGEKERRTLYSWGTLPHLVRAGTATVCIRLQQPERAAVYAINTSGKRLERVATRVEHGELVVQVSVAGPDGKARLAYELVAE